MRVYLLPDKNSQADRESWLRTQFGLGLPQTEIVNTVSDSNSVSGGNLPLARDARIVRDTDIVIPISIRGNGAMASLLETARSEGKRIVEDFECPYVDRAVPLAYVIGNEDLNPELSGLADRYIFHWTRATNTAWPGERLIDFYHDIMASESYPRSAFDTLCRILRDRLLIASSRHMPERIPTVSFSGLPLAETAPLMRWRARYSEMSFEPYGIGIDRRACERAGIRTVQYCNRSESVSEFGEERWLQQSIGSITDWRQEKEYRHRGDLSLAELSTDELVVVSRTPEEARGIENRFQIKAVSYCRL